MIARSRSKAWRQLGEILKPVRGPAVILSDGDAVFQPRKVERSGLWRAVDDRVLIYIHNGASAREFRKIILSVMKQGVKPQFVLAFRGPATKLVQTDQSQIKLMLVIAESAGRLAVFA